MSILIIVAAILAGLVLFSLIQKLIKWMLIFATLLVLTLVGGYLFLSGDGSMTEEYLPEEVQQEVNTLRDNTNQKIKAKTEETKAKAQEQVNQIAEDATNKMKEGIEQAVEDSKQSIEQNVQEVLSGKTTDTIKKNHEQPTEEQNTENASE